MSACAPYNQAFPNMLPSSNFLQSQPTEPFVKANAAVACPQISNTSGPLFRPQLVVSAETVSGVVPIASTSGMQKQQLQEVSVIILLPVLHVHLIFGFTVWSEFFRLTT